MSDLMDEFGEYEPCNPDSQPSRELQDWLKEPVEQWTLKEGTIDQETFESARDVWMEHGDNVLRADADLSGSAHPQMDPEAIRIVAPQEVRSFAVDLQPMVFESLGLAQIPLELMLATGETRPIIVGQMFGVPRSDGYVPCLLLETTATGGTENAVAQMHGMFHLLNDTFSDDPEEIGVLL